MGIKTTETDKKKWGAYCWYLLHLIAYKSQTDSDIDRQIKFFSRLYRIIPCPKCKDHYKEWLTKNPLVRDSNKHLIMPPRQSKTPDLVRWTIACHNNVNTMNNKPNLTENQVHGLFWVKALDGPDVLLVNHMYIVKLLQVLGNYHEEMGTLDTFKDFIYDLRKIMPCDECQRELKKNKDGNIEDYLDIISKCQAQNALKSRIGAQEQKYKV